MKKALSVAKKRIRSYLVGDLLRQQETLLLLQGRINAMQSAKLEIIDGLATTEFRVFSQFGEDGIIQYLTRAVPIEHEVFVEIGVQNYVESNTRFLLLNDNWEGSVVDASRRDIDFIRNDGIFWRHRLNTFCEFVTTENVEEILTRSGAPAGFGLLSIDVDGNDYWLWKAIRSFRPAIVVIEYNSLFGAEAAVTVPYRADFYRGSAHYSNLYFGASLAALCLLAEEKGYDFVGSNTAGNNAFFVRKDLAGNLRKYTAASGYVEAKFRESRNKSGDLTYLSPAAGRALIGECEVIDVKNGLQMKLKEILP